MRIGSNTDVPHPRVETKGFGEKAVLGKCSDDGIPRVDIVGGRNAVEDGDTGGGLSKTRVLAYELAGQEGGSVEPRGDG